jgi:predicted NUDIX family phosphoesterase
MASKEQVLVIERKILEEIGIFHGLAFNVDEYTNRIFAQGVPRFMPRSQAEDDPNYKQIIPYIIMTHNGNCLCYVRGKRAGEGRLVGNGSIGIGGHINPVDAQSSFDTDFREAYFRAVQREAEEEVHIETTYTDRIVALLNDDSNDVGKVHLGIVHCWHLDAPKVRKREQMITQMSFMSPTELQDMRDTLETWSSLCLDSLTDIVKVKETGMPSSALSG